MLVLSCEDTLFINSTSDKIEDILHEMKVELLWTILILWLYLCSNIKNLASKREKEEAASRLTLVL